MALWGTVIQVGRERGRPCPLRRAPRSPVPKSPNPNTQGASAAIQHASAHRKSKKTTSRLIHDLLKLRAPRQTRLIFPRCIALIAIAPNPAPANRERLIRAPAVDAVNQATSMMAIEVKSHNDHSSRRPPPNAGSRPNPVPRHRCGGHLWGRTAALSHHSNGRPQPGVRKAGVARHRKDLPRPRKSGRRRDTR